MGFEDMFKPLHSVDQFRTGLLDGSLSILTLFSQKVLPLVEAKGDKFVIARIVRASSPLLSAKSLRDAQQQIDALSIARKAVLCLFALWRHGASPTFYDVLRNVAATGLFEVPELLRPAAFSSGVSIDEPLVSDDQGPSSVNRQTERSAAIDAFLATPFGQINSYVQYVTNEARFGTHQGVKGLEFSRVMVVMDDAEARGFAFKYEKLFGGSDREDATTASTRRLFYVTCSRAERSLALVAYTKDPDRVRRHVIQQGWFDEPEVQVGL